MPSLWVARGLPRDFFLTTHDDFPNSFFFGAFLFFSEGSFFIMVTDSAFPQSLGCFVCSCLALVPPQDHALLTHPSQQQ
jgi:hypothetical protein